MHLDGARAGVGARRLSGIARIVSGKDWCAELRARAVLRNSPTNRPLGEGACTSHVNPPVKSEFGIKSIESIRARKQGSNRMHEWVH